MKQPKNEKAIEDLLKRAFIPLQKEELKKQLSITMHELNSALRILEKKGRILIGSKGVQYIYSNSRHMKMMLKDCLEI